MRLRIRHSWIALPILTVLSCGGETNPSNPAPVLTALMPDTASRGVRPVQITVSGSGFVSSSRVLWNGLERPTTYGSSTSLTAQLSSNDIGGASALVAVRNPPPGGGTSNALPFTIWGQFTPVPTLTSISPDRAPLGAPATTVRLTGTGFVPTSRVLVDGKQVTTTFVSVTALDAKLADTLFAASGLRQLAVMNVFPGGGTTTAIPFSVESPTPTITGLNTPTVTAGLGGATIMVDGTAFVPGTVIRFSGAPRVTTRVSATRLSAQLLAGDLRDPGTYDITAFTPAPGGGVSNALPLAVVAATPVIASLPSSSAAVGMSGVSVGVDGSGFVPGVTVTINGQDRATTFTAGDRLSFVLTASDVATPATLSLAVRNPGGSPPAQPTTLTIRSTPIADVRSLIKIPGEATDLLYDSVTARIYAPMRDGPYRGRLIAIDPTTGQITASVPIDESGRLEMTSDRQFLYLVLNPASISSQSTIRRLSFPSLATQLQFTVPVGVSDIATLPGSPLSVVLASSPTVQLYVDGLLHELTPLPPSDITKITVGPNAQTLYGMVSNSSFAFVTMSVAGDGVHIVSSVDNMPPGNAIAFAGGRYYTSGTGTQSYQRAGTIDPRGPPVIVGRFPGYGAQFLPDPVLGRLYMLVGSVVTAYDLNSFSPLGAVNVDPTSPPLDLSLSTGRLVKWGTDGLAVYDFYNVYIFRTGLAAP